MKSTTNLIDKISIAKQECEYNDEISHVKQVRALAHEFLTKQNLDTTPDITINKHKVSFHKGISGTPESITMNVDGEKYSGSEMNAMICRLDHIGNQWTSERNRIEKITKIKNSAQATKRVIKVDFTRKLLNEPIKAASEGNSLFSGLMRLLGRTLSKAVQSR